MNQDDQSLDGDIVRIAEQEQRLRFAAFNEETAWELGSRLRALARDRGVAVTVEIRLARETVFLQAMPGTSPSNADWARRKRNTVELLGRSSYGVGRSHAKEGNSLEASMGLPTRDYANHGGAFPIRLADAGGGAVGGAVGGALIGVVTVSGLPQREDHAMVVEVLAAMCGVSPEAVMF